MGKRDVLLDTMRSALTSSGFLVTWAVLCGLALAILAVDLRRANARLGTLMKLVWALTILYSGPLGLVAYYAAGRRQIPRDTVWRRGLRSVAHCYSGCGAGEALGVVLAAGLLSLGGWSVTLVTFALAYVAGYALTVGPLLHDGVAPAQALWDAFSSETASITVMEITAIGVDRWLAGAATLGEPLFWSSLIVSLSSGLLAAYPVNVLLVWWGVKAGMHSPAEE